MVIVHFPHVHPVPDWTCCPSTLKLSSKSQKNRWHQTTKVLWLYKCQVIQGWGWNCEFLEIFFATLSTQRKCWRYLKEATNPDSFQMKSLLYRMHMVCNIWSLEKQRFLLRQNYQYQVSKKKVWQRQVCYRKQKRLMQRIKIIFDYISQRLEN